MHDLKKLFGRVARSLTIQHPIAFTVVAAQPLKLTLAVDLDRQLRYFANTRTDFNPPNPGMPAGTSYFFGATGTATLRPLDYAGAPAGPFQASYTRAL